MRTHPSGPGSLRPRWGQALPLLIIASLFGTALAGESPMEVRPQTLQLPPDAWNTWFVALEKGTPPSLFVLDRSGRQLLNYRQDGGVFGRTPAQNIPLPPTTSWVSLLDVDPRPGLELVMSTSTGVVYSCEVGGLFELERHALLQTNQILTNAPLLVPWRNDRGWTNPLISVVTSGEAVTYSRSPSYQWLAKQAVPLHGKVVAWEVGRDPSWELESWSAGQTPSQAVLLREQFRAESEKSPREPPPENETIAKIIEDMKKTAVTSPPASERIDLDRDGRTDLVVWRVTGRTDFRTDLYIFLRGPDGKLPLQPNQVLHCRGLPIPLGSMEHWLPVHDLNGDGVAELVLLEFKTNVHSASGLIETALSHGLKWGLATRTFHNGAFSRDAEASVPVTLILPAEVLNGWPIFVDGDFNGDGRLDLLVRRTDTLWDVFTSTTDGTWFSPQIAFTFNTPMNGYMEITDVSGDGLSDVVWHEPESSTLSIYVTPALSARRTKP